MPVSGQPDRPEHTHILARLYMPQPPPLPYLIYDHPTSTSAHDIPFPHYEAHPDIDPVAASLTYESPPFPFGLEIIFGPLDEHLYCGRD